MLKEGHMLCEIDESTKNMVYLWYYCSYSVVILGIFLVKLQLMLSCFLSLFLSSEVRPDKFVGLSSNDDGINFTLTTSLLCLQVK